MLEDIFFLSLKKRGNVNFWFYKGPLRFRIYKVTFYNQYFYMTQHKMVMVNSRLLFKSDMLYLRGVTAPGFFFFFYSFAYWKEEATMQSTFVTIENRIMAFGLICFNSAIDIMPKSIWTYGNWRLSFSSIIFCFCFWYLFCFFLHFCQFLSLSSQGKKVSPRFSEVCLIFHLICNVHFGLFNPYCLWV